MDENWDAYYGIKERYFLGMKIDDAPAFKIFFPLLYVEACNIAALLAIGFTW